MCMGIMTSSRAQHAREWSPMSGMFRCGMEQTCWLLFCKVLLPLKTSSGHNTYPNSIPT